MIREDDSSVHERFFNRQTIAYQGPTKKKATVAEKQAYSADNDCMGLKQQSWLFEQVLLSPRFQAMPQDFRYHVLEYYDKLLHTEPCGLLAYEMRRARIWTERKIKPQ